MNHIYMETANALWIDHIICLKQEMGYGVFVIHT